MPTNIHPRAVIADGAEIGQDVWVGPHTVIGPQVRIGDGTRIGPQVVIDGATSIGRDNHILGQANLGGVPQDLSYENEETFVEIGDRNTIREFVTINRGTVKGGGVTKVGSDCLFMACSHVAHDCEIADQVILANNVLLAGHVAVGDSAIINGAAAAHQFVTIGRNSYVGGLTRVIFDVPPFMIVEGHPARVRKVNIIGLERGGVSRDEIQELRAAYRRLFRSAEPQNRVLSELEGLEHGACVRELIEALRRTERGAKGRYREVLRDEFRRLGEERLEGGHEPVTADPLRVAVVGVGHLGRIHARIYAESPDADLRYVVDTDEERARTVAAEVGAEPLGSPTDLPADLDAVSVVVPTVAHAAVAVPLLARGVGCLVEKPLAPDLREADQILAAAEEGGATLAVGHVERFQPGVRKVRELGLEPRFIECHRLSSFSFRSTDVGVVHDLMIHDLDLLLHFVDSEVQSFDAVGGKILTPSEDVASVRLVFANGARANVTASRASLSPMRRFRMFSPSSYVSLDFTKNQGLLVHKGPEFDAKLRELYEVDPSQAGDIAEMLPAGLIEISELELGGQERPLQAELASFLSNVRAGTTPEVGGEDGRRALELAERIRAEIVAQPW